MGGSWAADTSVSAGIFAHDTEFISWSHLARSGAATGLQAPAAHASQVLRWWWTAREDLKALPALARIAQPRPTCGGMARGNDCAECNGAPPTSATKRRSAALALVCWAAPRCCKLSHAPTQTCHSKSLAAIPRRMHRISSASEVKRRRARFVLGWGTAREDLRVPALRFEHGSVGQAAHDYRLSNQQRKPERPAFPVNGGNTVSGAACRVA